MDYKDIAKALGLDLAERTVMSVVIPWIEAKVADSETEIDDEMWAKVKPILIELVDKINGKDDY